HRLPRRREQAGGEVERLVDDHVVGGAHEVGLHFLGHGEHAVAHDLGNHRIDLAGLPGFPDGLTDGFLRHHFAPATAMTRLPQGSTIIRSRGIITVVEACSSISAGPLSRLPASSSARRQVGTARDLPSNDALRLPVKADFGGALPPFLIFSCGGFFITPATVTRRLTISARSSGAEAP